MFNIRLSGELGHWLCTILLSEMFIWWGTKGSNINLAIVTIDRYLLIVHPAFSKRWVRPWVIYSACALSWFVAILFITPMVFLSADVVDGICSVYQFRDYVADMAMFITNMMVFYVNVLAICIFGYWRILLVIRRQARVMASHSAAGPSNASQAQSHRIQSNVKTMILVSALYVISFLPLIIYRVLVVAGIMSYTYHLMIAAFTQSCA